VTAVLSESIRAVIWGSLQTFAELEGVEPGAVATGVSESELGTGTNPVDVTTRLRGVEVGAVSVGEAQAASRTKQDRSMGTSFNFIVSPCAAPCQYSKAILNFLCYEELNILLSLIWCGT